MVSAPSYSTIVMLCFYPSFHPSFQQLSSNFWKDVKCSECVHVGKLLVCCENASVKVLLWDFLWREPEISIACVGDLPILPVKLPLTSSILRKAHCGVSLGIFCWLVLPWLQGPWVDVGAAKVSTGSCRYLCPHFAIADLHLPSKVHVVFPCPHGSSHMHGGLSTKPELVWWSKTSKFLPCVHVFALTSHLGWNSRHEAANELSTWLCFMYQAFFGLWA